MSLRSAASVVLRRVRGVWDLALREHASPREIGHAVGLGVFCGCSPAIGFHASIALGMATLFRLSRLWALLGSRTCIFFLLPWIALAEVETGHRLRTGAWAVVKVDTVLREGRGLLVDWILGFLIVGSLLGLVFGAIAYRLARRYHARQTTVSADLGPSADRPPHGLAGRRS